MAMVCKEYFPMGSYKYQMEAGFYMDTFLKDQLDFLIKNIKDDWAFTGIISGRGEIRVGKSIIAMQIAFYWITEVNRIYKKNYRLSVPDNFVFNGNELIAKGNKLGTEQPFAVIIYDEAGADIQGVKVMSGSTQEVLDYLRECGQYNMLTLLVLPDYFSLPRGIAMVYSTFLIDVTYYATEEGLFERGHYKFYSRPKKKRLFLLGKKFLDYDSTKPDFQGEFNNVFTVDEKEYRDAKKIALKKREKPLNRREKKVAMQRNLVWFELFKQGKNGYDILAMYQGIETDLELTKETIDRGILEAKKFMEMLGK